MSRICHRLSDFFTEGLLHEHKAMQSTRDPLSNAPISEIWGIVWLRYTAAMGLVMLYYDCLLTLDDEVRLTFLYLYYFSCLIACSLGSPCLARAPYLAKRNVLH